MVASLPSQCSKARTTCSHRCSSSPRFRWARKLVAKSSSTRASSSSSWRSMVKARCVVHLLTSHCKGQLIPGDGRLRAPPSTASRRFLLPHRARSRPSSLSAPVSSSPVSSSSSHSPSSAGTRPTTRDCGQRTRWSRRSSRCSWASVPSAVRLHLPRRTSASLLLTSVLCLSRDSIAVNHPAIPPRRPLEAPAPARAALARAVAPSAARNFSPRQLQGGDAGSTGPAAQAARGQHPGGVGGRRLGRERQCAGR